MPKEIRLKEMNFKQVGSRPVRPDGVDKVTGRAKYGADHNLPGQLHALVLRSPHAHARVVSIDVTEALTMPGVHAVLTHADVPGENHGVTRIYRRPTRGL